MHRLPFHDRPLGHGLGTGRRCLRPPSITTLKPLYNPVTLQGLRQRGQKLWTNRGISLGIVIREGGNTNQEPSVSLTKKADLKGERAAELPSLVIERVAAVCGAARATRWHTRLT